MWGTGDGLYFALWDVEETSYASLYSAARRLIDQMDAVGLQLRIALHSGYSHELRLPLKRKEVAGTGLNDVARLVNFADGGQVVMSERFFADMQPAERHALVPDVRPALGDEPLVVFAKHGVRMGVRFDSAHASSRMRLHSFCHRSHQFRTAEDRESP